MDKYELAQRLARRSRQSKGNAADRVDALVYKLLKSAKGGGALDTATVLRVFPGSTKQPKQVIPVRTRRDGNVPGLSKAPVKES